MGLKHFHSAPTIAKVERLRKDGWFPVASHGCSNPTSCSCPKTSFPMTKWTTHGSTTCFKRDVLLGVLSQG